MIPNRHYAQSSLSRRRKAARAERVAKGEADQPRRCWKKRRGVATPIVRKAQ